MNPVQAFKNVPFLGKAAEWLGARVNRHRLKAFYLYRLKPCVLSLLIRTVQRMLAVPAIVLTKGDCIVDSGGARFHWVPGNPFSLLGYPLRGDFENLETEIMTHMAAGSGVVIDVGANFGWYSCHIRRVMRPGSELHLFEPVPAVREELIRNLALNPAEGVETIVNGICLSDSEGIVQLHVPKSLGSAFASMEAQNYKGGFESIDVRASTLDEYCREMGIPSIGLVKIDVEGAELKVLKGARGLLSSKDKPFLMVECEGTLLSSTGATVQEVIDFILGFGYVGYLVVGGLLYRLSPETIGKGYDYIFVDPASPFIAEMLEPMVEGRSQ